MRKVAVIGAGLQAGRRVTPIVQSKEFELAWVIDHKIERAEALAKGTNAKTGTNWRDAVNDAGVEVVLVLTYPDTHAEIGIAALESGKHVLCEKPLTRTVEEARALVAAAHKTGKILKCGFNHRHHPAVLEAKKIVDAGEIGKPVFGRAKYGIGGRIGVEKEWRSDPKIVSGGQLMEQGIHVIDLFRWFCGDVARATGFVSTTRWPIAPLEDNGFALLEMKGGAICSVHSSLTQWTNLFEFEVYGEKGSVTVEALGASYGVEMLHVALHDPTGPFAKKTTEFRGGDSSWKSEWEELVRAIASGKQPIGNGDDGLRAIEIVDAVYSAAKTGNTAKF